MSGADDSEVIALVLSVVTAVNSRALYPSAHPRNAEAVERWVQSLDQVLNARGQLAITLLVVNQDLVVDAQPLGKGSLTVKGFVRALDRLGVEGITLVRGLTREEAAGFLDVLAERGTAASTDHIQVGSLRLGFGVTADGGEAAESAAEGASRANEGAAGGGRSGIDHAARLADAAQRAAVVFASWRQDRRSGVAIMERLIWSAIDALAQSADALVPLGLLRNHDEATFAHSLNVALLVLAHGRALGLRGEALKDTGLGALLHDTGKLALPADLLREPGRMQPHQWELVCRHPQIGAAMLCEVRDLPAIAVLVAYEHHLRYDGLPGYPVLADRRRPNLASSLTAVADTYDSFVGRTPTDLRRAAAFTLLRRRAGTFLDPLLVHSFCALFESATPGPGSP